MVGLLGILKAGGAYLPLDPDYPADRLAFMVEDSRAPIIVTQRAFAAIVPPNDGRHARWRRRVQRPTRGCRSRARPAALDEPRPHRASRLRHLHLRLHRQAQGRDGRAPQRRATSSRHGRAARSAISDGTWLAVTSLSFDISVLELLWTLTRGFKVVVQRRQPRRARRQAPRPARCRHVARRAHAASTSACSISPATRRRARRRQVSAAARRRASSPTARLHRRVDAGAPLPRVRRPLPEPGGHQRRGRRDDHARVRSAPAASCCRCTIPRASPRSGRWSTTCRNGRVGISFASGWQPNDFVLRARELSPTRKAVMIARHRHRAPAVARRDGRLPAARRATTSRSRRCRARCSASCRCGSRPPAIPETFRMAGRSRRQRADAPARPDASTSSAQKIDVYREALRERRRHAGDGARHADAAHLRRRRREAVRETVRGPMKEYLAARSA